MIHRPCPFASLRARLHRLGAVAAFCAMWLQVFLAFGAAPLSAAHARGAAMAGLAAQTLCTPNGPQSLLIETADEVPPASGHGPMDAPCLLCLHGLAVNLPAAPPPAMPQFQVVSDQPQTADRAARRAIQTPHHPRAPPQVS